MPGGGRKTNTSVARWLVFSMLSVVLCLPVGARNITKVQAQASRKIDATVQVSVCGNAVTEGGEQCDSTDLSGKSCSSLQYESGALSCTKSCDFDLSKCVPFVNFAGEVLIPAIARPPTPTIKPVSTPLLIATDSVSQAQLDDAVSELPEPETTQILLPLTSESQQSDDQVVQPILPPELIELRLQSIFELLEIQAITETNQIDQSYLPALVHNWSQSWRKTTTLARFTTPTEVEQQVIKCDANGDGVCTVEDLSILLYYVSAKPKEQQP